MEKQTERTGTLSSKGMKLLRRYKSESGNGGRRQISELFWIGSGNGSKQLQVGVGVGVKFIKEERTNSIAIRETER